MAQIAFSTNVAVELENGTTILPVEVDEHVFAALKGDKNPELVRDYCRMRAMDLFALQRILGLQQGGIRKITICSEKCPKSEDLFTKNDTLWEKLRVKASHPKVAEKRQWICAEDDACACSWCVEVTGSVFWISS